MTATEVRTITTEDGEVYEIHRVSFDGRTFRLVTIPVSS